MSSSVFSYCPHCGKPLPPAGDLRFCPFCGEALGTEGPATPPVAGELESQVLALLKDKKAIEAIKAYRLATQTGLKEAKGQVEAIGRKHEIPLATSAKKIGFGALLIFCVWAGFMFATAGLAVFPSLGKVASPFVCQGTIEVSSHHYNPYPGKSVTTRQFFCPDGKEVSWKTTFWSFFIYTALIFSCLILWLGLRRLISSGKGAAGTEGKLP